MQNCIQMLCSMCYDKWMIDWLIKQLIPCFNWHCAGARVSQITRTVSWSCFIPSRYVGNHGPVAEVDYQHGTDWVSEQLCTGHYHCILVLIARLVLKAVGTYINWCLLTYLLEGNNTCVMQYLKPGLLTRPWADETKSEATLSEAKTTQSEAEATES